jgi:hypothetical protein
LAEKLTFPEGAIGVNATPASWAVKVTESLTFVKLEGEAVKLSVVASALMFWRSAGALAPWKLASPENVAPIESEPTGNDDVVQVAFPAAVTAIAAQPAIDAPFDVNVTVPVGATGVSTAPPRDAVNVTSVLMLVELEGEAVTPRVGVSAVMV